MPSVPRYSKISDYLARSIKPPCMTCTERTAGCHGKCEGYKKYKKHLEDEKSKAYSTFVDSIKVEDYEIKRRVRSAKIRGK